MPTADGAGIVLDADQGRAARRLRELVDRRGRPVRRRRGIYLYGRPGRGKTMVMDRFFARVASDRKRRFHFHQFFAQLHAAQVSRSIEAAVDTLVGDARLVCFDEFHVHDIGDAMLIARMLDVLFARRIVLVLTSNYPPVELLPNPLFHERFRPTIDRITERLDVVSLDGPLDYRTRTDSGSSSGRPGFAAGRYSIAPSDRGNLPAAEPVAVPIGPRQLLARSAVGAELVIDFAALCGTPTAASDYVELARRFRRWTILDVPALGDVPPDWVMRLVNLIDVLYDSDRELHISARTPLPKLLDGVRNVPDISRLASRLCELSQLAASRIG